MDRRARRAFEDEHKGPSKFAGKRTEHRTQEELRWRVPNGLQWVEWQEPARDEVWVERLARLHQECPGIRVHHTTGNACVGAMQVGKYTEEEAQRRIKDAGERWRQQVVVQHKLELERVTEDLAARWKIIPGDNTRLEEVMDTAIQEVLRRSDSVPGQARIGSKGLRGSQEYRWVTTGSGARLEMEAWLRHLDTDPPSVASFQLKWDQQRLVLSCSGLKEAAEASTGGAHVRTNEGGPAPAQLKHGIERSGERGRLRGGGQGQTRIEPPAAVTRAQGEDKRVRIVTLTVPTLSLVDALLTESQTWDSEALVNR